MKILWHDRACEGVATKRRPVLEGAQEERVYLRRWAFGILRSESYGELVADDEYLCSP